MRMRIPDGVPELVREEASYTRKSSWSRDGQILTATGNGLEIGPADGGPSSILLPSQPVKGLVYPTMPMFLPDGEHFVFVAYDPEAAGGAEGGHGIYLAGWRSGKWTLPPVRLRAGALAARYSPLMDGSLLFVQGDDLYAQHLNLAKARLEGGSTQVVRGVASKLTGGPTFFSISLAGALVWQPGRTDASQLTWFNRTGKILGTTGPPASWHYITISPDEQQVAMTVNTDILQLGILQSGKSGFLPLKTSGPNRLVYPGCDWIPASNEILYGEESGNTIVLVQRSAAGGLVRESGPIDSRVFIREISADGKQLLLSDNLHLKLFRYPLEDGLPSREPAAGDDYYGSLSPDARWAVYVSGSPRQAFARPLMGSGAPIQISNSQGLFPGQPTWRGDGREILYVDGDQIWSVNVDLARGQFAAPVPLFKVQIPVGTFSSKLLAVTRDGSRILAPVTTEPLGATTFHVMTDWTAAVKRQ
jgi:hypothetical protein